MKVEIITVSDTQLTSELPDVEAKHAARAVHSINVELTSMITVAEAEAIVEDALWCSMSRADVVLVIGEIRPGHGVLLPALAKVLGQRVVPENPGITGAAVLGMPGERDKYALMLRGVSSLVAVLPKNRLELAFLLDTEVLPFLRREPASNAVARWGLLRSAGVSRTMVEERLRDLTLNVRQRVHYASYADRTDIRVWVEADTVAEAEVELQRLMHNVRHRLGNQVYGNGSDRLETVIYDHLSRHGLTLVLAEINTGSAIAREWRELAVSNGPVQFVETDEIDAALHRLHLSDEPVVATCQSIASDLRVKYGTDLCLLVYNNVNPGGVQVFVCLANEAASVEDQFSYGGHPQSIAESAATRGLTTLRRWLLSNNLE